MTPRTHCRKVKSKKFIQAYPARDISYFDLEELKELERGKHYRQVLYISQSHNIRTGVVFEIERQIYKAVDTYIVPLVMRGE